MVEHAKRVSSVLDLLDELGRTEDTIVVYVRSIGNGVGVGHRFAPGGESVLEESRCCRTAGGGATRMATRRARFRWGDGVGIVGVHCAFVDRVVDDGPRDCSADVALEPHSRYAQASADLSSRDLVGFARGQVAVNRLVDERQPAAQHCGRFGDGQEIRWCGRRPRRVELSPIQKFRGAKSSELG